MYIHDATEVAYKNGYERGYDQGVKDFAKRVKQYYSHYSSRPLPANVVYYIDQIQKDLLKEDLSNE